ncbi:putative heat shock protein HslVU, ATPase subunit HslU [Trypanosoma rangeli]|uniref:von Willebrand factor A domain-containing protein 8 n=1 Tax=Trypanosoma rangeli TaxID=5698 RepID=A0A3S5IRB8_TRYRA|nr:putative heat shock protein HslVU, ATPase subunit HslU [Trypanosoma rangeli]RNF05748.1 putative heat shock protein HslVU, ATPase subunit HslU [Trypanosoma rangeli]|eukprot:RNF05748.1 putative heat shock protein HslVU, ATPase subunit HslU [Trypanosoma rangeli]
MVGSAPPFTRSPLFAQGRGSSSDGLLLTIGDVTVPVPTKLHHPEHVNWLLPGAATCGNGANKTDARDDIATSDFGDRGLQLHGGNAFFQMQDPTTLSYLRWMCQKEQLRQDMCLVGEPGPALRWLVQMYSYLVRREVQYLSLNRDTTESDLGQRREIRNGTLVYNDQCVVVAAREGQLLLLEGLEKVERNVLPVINNLLENREMHLENGMMLIHPERYDRLLQELLTAKRGRYEHGGSEGHGRDADGAMRHAAAQEELRRMGFIRVSENFRVVGLTVPVPPYEGNPLDPPLRSRFQCLYVDIPLPGLAATQGGVTAATAVRGGRGADATESLLKLRAIIDEVNTNTKDFIVGGKQASGSRGKTSNNPQINNGGGGGGGGGGAAMAHCGLQTIGSYELAMLSRQLQLFPDIPVGELLPRAFPWMLYAQQTATAGAAHIEEATRRRREYERVLAACHIGAPLYEYRHGSTDANRDNFGTVDECATSCRPSRDFSLTREKGKMRQIKRGDMTFRHRRSNCSGSERSTEVDRSPEEFNDVLQVENIRVVEYSRNTVVGDACIACSNDGGTYRLPIYMGGSAVPATQEEAAKGIVVAERCPTPRSVFTPAHYHVLQSMLQLHIAGQHILLLGPNGCGKTTILREFANLVGYRTETMYLYADMTNKDLFQRRTTDSSAGDTLWENSPLVEAALSGHIAVLDGIDKLPSGMLSSLQQLLVDGSMSLYDGTLLRSQREYEILKRELMATDEEMRARQIFSVHPSFRVVATARYKASAGSCGKVSQGSWRVTHEVTSLFGVVIIPATTRMTLHAVLLRVATTELQEWRKQMGVLAEEDNNTISEVTLEAVTRDIDRLLRLCDALERLQETEPKVPQLSLRQLLHLIRFRVRYPEDFTPGVESALLLPLMNALTAEQVRQVMCSCGFDDVSRHKPEQQRQQHPYHQARNTAETEADLEGRRSKRHDVLVELKVSNTLNMITDVNGRVPARVFGVHGKPIFCSNRVYSEEEQAMVPYVTHFHSNPVHESIIAWLAKQYAVGNNILLIGNQGVGKNKVVDAFLARIGVPRQYIQLHRDTTVGTLTINPTVEAGRVVWSDSPLVKAVQRGHCLVVDEIDKAPVEVVQVLKGLVEDHEMHLRDGRQIRGPRAHAVAADRDALEGANIITMHPDFRIIVLANPPGFPFHGNDFYRECGDLFASYVMGNPDAISQLRLLKAYAPNIPEAVLVRLIGAFQRLQKSFEEGHLTYPFSLRELIAVVKHMAAFPHDGIYDALNNVFNFDARNENTLHLVRQVLHLHLHPLMSAGGMQRLLPLRAGQPLPLQVLQQPLEVPSVSQALPTTSAVGDTASLPVRFLTDAECGGPCSVQFVSTWCERYREAEFAATVPSGESKGFTEWLSAPRLPFLRAGDIVLAITPMDTDVGTGALVTLAVLFLREEDPSDANHKNSGSKRVVVAIVAPQSVVSLGMAAVRRSHLPPGQIQFFDLTRFLPAVAALSAFSVSAPMLLVFNAESHSTSLAAVAPAGWLHDAFGVPAPLVAVVDAPSGFVLLINTLTAAAPSSHVAPQQHAAPEECTCGAVLPVRLAPPFPEASSCCASVRPMGSVVAMTRARSAELFVWMNARRIAVKLPAVSIDTVQFVTDNLAMVSLQVGETVLKCVLKVAVSADGEAKASLCQLPNSIAGDIVGFVGNHAPASLSNQALLQPLTPDELKGAVIVPSGSGASRGDAVYMTVEEYSPEKQTWLMRVYTDTDAAAAVGAGSLHVNHSHHQLLATETSSAKHRGRIVAVDFHQRTVRCFSSPFTAAPSAASSQLQAAGNSLLALDEGAGVALWYDNATQRVLVADVVEERVQQRYRNWSALLEGSVNQIGAAASTPRQSLSMTYTTPRKKPSGTLKHGKDDNEEHHGGNTYAGGTGGTDTAGLGGLVGPYRLDKGWPVHQVSPEEKQRVSPRIIEEAKRMGKAALEERLRDIGMSAREYEQYRSLQERVRAPVALLRSLLSGLKAAEGERTWLRGQTDGVWDDSKIVEGIVGERNIYRRRADSTETNPFQSKHKKRLLFVLDVSASMYRFEGMDHRLTKLLESTVMVMEAFAGFEDKIDYAMVGHNGDSACIELVPFGHPFANQKARMEVCQRMVAHAQYCWSGDNTVEAMRQSVDLVTAEKGDAYLVFVISDANLARYGISPRELGAIMRSHREVQMFCIFIATLGEQAENLQAEMLPGHGFECFDTQALPHILKQIFISVNLL